MLERFQNVEVKITDVSFLQSIPLKQVDLFLTSRGWRCKPCDNLTIYSDPFSRQTVTLSRNEDFDYAGRLQQALETLQDVFQYNQLVLVDKILSAKPQKKK